MPSTTRVESLRFAAGAPPPALLNACPDIESKGRVLCLWEMTMGLIKNESFLSSDPNRYLAMIADHRRAFTTLLQTEDLPRIPEIEYLHAKLVDVDPLPVFLPSGFKSLQISGKEDRRDRIVPVGLLADALEQDPQMKAHFERLKCINRELSEIEASKPLIELHLYGSP